MKLNLLLILVACVGMTACWKKISQEEPPHCQIIHRPPGGCPSGYTEAGAIFKEKDGSKQYGCQATRETECQIDLLLPGESIGISPIPLDSLPTGQPKRSL